MTPFSDAYRCVNITGVYLCKHADILQPTAFHNGQTGYLIIFKILKVSRLMHKSRTWIYLTYCISKPNCYLN